MQYYRCSVSAVLFVLAAAGWQYRTAAEERPFVIRVIDESTGRGVPMVELRTTAATRHYSDSQGVVAFQEPGWMGRRVFFYVASDGYRLAPDGFGFEGQAFTVEPGKQVTLPIQRTMIAQRLYRVTGAGIYRDSVLAGLAVPIRHPLLNAGVVGSDSVVNAVYGGKLYWFWGDTNRTEYPLGNFHVPGATSRLPADGGMDPYEGVDLEYFVDPKTNFAKETARMPGEGPTWINGLMVINDQRGEETLLAAYVKVKPPLNVYQHGLCRWNRQAEQFEPLVVFPENAPLYPTGHPWIAQDHGDPYVFFTDPLGVTRSPAHEAAVKDLSQYEAYTCFTDGATASQQGPLPAIDRHPDGTVRYRWRRNTSPMRPDIQRRLIAAGQLKPEEALICLRDRDTGKEILIHSGAVAWNAFRKRWMTIFVQMFGDSVLGEVWYAEADAPWGPWVYAVKVASHSRYSFYNPKVHPYFEQRDGRRIFFEGTYSHSFSGNPEQKPWYDYNQLMYCLELDDPRVALPVGYYEPGDRQGIPVAWPPTGDHSLEKAPKFEDFRRIAFFALDRPTPSTVPLYYDGAGKYHASADVPDGYQVIAHILPGDAENKPASVVAIYAVPSAQGAEKLVPAHQPPPHSRFLGWVWPSPYRE